MLKVKYEKIYRRISIIRFKYIVVCILIFFFNSKAFSLELIMINSKNCVYCKKFLSEVEPEYDISELPLVIIDNYNPPKWFKKAYKQKKIKPYRGTPTFIIWNTTENYEIDRIIGYRGKDRFYKQLKEMFIAFINENENT